MTRPWRGDGRDARRGDPSVGFNGKPALLARETVRPARDPRLATSPPLKSSRRTTPERLGPGIAPMSERVDWTMTVPVSS